MSNIFNGVRRFDGAEISKLQVVTSQVALKVLVHTVKIFGPESSIEILHRPLAGVGVFLRYLSHEPYLDKTSWGRFVGVFRIFSIQWDSKG